MFFLGKARHRFERWLRGESNTIPTASYSDTGHDEQPTDYQDNRQRISRFMEDLKENSQEWLGRVRLINFDSIKERVGPTWPKLQSRVEILAEKIIREEMRGKDQCLNLGGAEFLVFFADAIPEESRIRCLAIVEAIHEKLFGSEEQEHASHGIAAECHVIHVDDLSLEWETGDFNNPTASEQRSAADALRRSFRNDAEYLDEADITTSTQIAIDSIIAKGIESRDMSDLTSLLVRLKVLSRSLKTLEPVLISARRERPVDFRTPSQSSGGAFIGLESPNHDPREADAVPLSAAWNDIAELISVVDGSLDLSHEDLLAALAELQRARLDRMKTAEEGISAPRLGRNSVMTGLFEYVPVYRSTSRGEHIHQGIYRACYRVEKNLGGLADGDTVSHIEAMALERLNLEHAIDYLLDFKVSARCILLVSVHVETLRSPNSQRQYSTILRSAQLRAKRRLLIEIVDYRDTDDTIGIRRAIEEIRVHSHAVFVTISGKSISNLEKIVIECRKQGVHAIGINVSQFRGRKVEVFDTLARVSSVGEEHSIPIYIDGIASIPILAKAIACGASYVCAPTLRPPLHAPDDVERATLDDLYSMV